MAFHPRDRLPWNRHLSRREALKLLGGTVVAGGVLPRRRSGGSPPSAAPPPVWERDHTPKPTLFVEPQPIEPRRETA